MNIEKIVYAFVFLFLVPALGRAENLFKYRVVAYIGDSLTEGLGVSKDQAYPQQVEELLLKKGIKIKTINAGVSGATSASALPTVKWVSRSKPDLYVFALGANDALRGLSTEALRKNLAQAIESVQKQKGADILLLGMKAPPNMGKSYAEKFQTIYSTLVTQYKVEFVPFMLEGVAAQKEFNQKDGIHPNAEGHKIIARLAFQKILSMGTKR